MHCTTTDSSSKRHISNRTENTAGQGRAGQGRAGQGRAGLGWAGQGKEQVESRKERKYCLSMSIE